MSTPEQTRSIDVYPFGFTFETFATQVLVYVAEMRKDLDENPLTEEDEKAFYYKRLKQSTDRTEEEIAHLNTRMADDPQALFNFVEGIYNTAKKLEEEGVNRDQVAHKLLDDHEEELWPLLGLIEHGLAQPWGYRLAQVTMAVGAERRYKED
ncbi:MAG: hypothetical protein ABI425_06175 [Patescibacteria group bacterium]